MQSVFVNRLSKYERVCLCVCVFMSYIASVTVQKHDTSLTVWHLATQRMREAEREKQSANDELLEGSS